MRSLQVSFGPMVVGDRRIVRPGETIEGRPGGAGQGAALLPSVATHPACTSDQAQMARVHRSTPAGSSRMMARERPRRRWPPRACAHAAGMRLQIQRVPLLLESFQVSD